MYLFTQGGGGGGGGGRWTSEKVRGAHTVKLTTNSTEYGKIVHKITNVRRLDFMILKRENLFLNFQGPPLPMALEMDFLTSSHYVTRHINNRYINS